MNTPQPTILIVDDEIINIHSLARILRDTARLCFAKSGNQALQMAKKLQAEIILLDVMLPDLSGFEVCKQLKNDPDSSRSSVVFITALDKTAEEARGLRLGALDYITKPFNPTIVRMRVQNLLNLTMAYRKLEELSTTDFLTGVFNRRYLVEIANTELKRHQRHNKNTSILMIDIDHFKQINDKYGHSVGDRALQHLVRLCRKNLRNEDIFARYGGEEFCVILPETDAATSNDTAERLRQTIKNNPMEFDEQLVHMTISIGLSGVYPNENDDFNYWIERADQALYQAKRNGRDQVVWYK